MLKKTLAAIAIVFVAIQFVRPTKNISTAQPGADDVTVRFTPPAEIRRSLEIACYDCHSNNTRYPWYAEVQPVGWWLGNHVSEGKRELNFSELGSYPAKKLARKFNAISDQVLDHEMPLASYTWIHRDARLTPAQVQAIANWADDWHDRIAPADAK